MMGTRPPVLAVANGSPVPRNREMAAVGRRRCTRQDNSRVPVPRNTRGGPAPPDKKLRGSWFRETRGGPAPPDKKLRGSWFRETRGGPAPPDKKHLTRSPLLKAERVTSSMTMASRPGVGRLDDMCGLETPTLRSL